MDPQQELASLRQDFEARGDQRFKVALVDIDGILRGKYLNVSKLATASKGFGFCDVVFGWDSSDVCYDNTSFTGWHSGYPDLKAKIDLSSMRRIPWDKDTPFFLVDLFANDGQPLAIDPRQVLRRVEAYAARLGFETKVGSEFEWFNFRESSESLNTKGHSHPTPISPGMFGYSILRTTKNNEFLTQLMDQLRGFGLAVEGLHTETGPGVLEACMIPANASQAGDQATLFKTACKEIAIQNDLTATFMARWNTTLPGSSGHLHLSLLDSYGKPVFFDAQDPHNMSQTFKHFIAGQIRYIPEMLALMAPTVNSYKRLVEGYWAPTRMNWGIDNRTSALRIIKDSEAACRVEVRVPGADMNPQLAIAAALGAGLRGIEERLELCQAPVKGNGYQDQKAEKLASNLLDASVKLSESMAAAEVLGESFVQHFVATRQWEWRRFQQEVTDWELKRYFEII